MVVHWADRSSLGDRCGAKRNHRNNRLQSTSVCLEGLCGVAEKFSSIRWSRGCRILPCTRLVYSVTQVLCARLHQVFGPTSARIFNGHLLKTMLQVRHVLISGTRCSNSSCRSHRTILTGALRFNLKFHHLCTSCGRRRRSRPLHSASWVAEAQFYKAKQLLRTYN